MAKATVTKQNKSFARLFIVLGTLVAGLGIWLAVNHVPASASSAPTTPQDVSIANPNFNTNDTFLSQSQIQALPRQSQPARSPRLRTRGS